MLLLLFFPIVFPSDFCNAAFRRDIYLNI